MYLSLYRKWRPKTFEDVVSQNHITSTLKNEIISEKIAHAYLFTGPRGTGKTSCAKIFAKTINCLDIKNGEPCLSCSICKGMDNESILDIVEMDGASNNSVNDIRDLIEEASYSPAVCRYRVYIIDEVHMLSQSAFNALLKIMEEPPRHVVFILATTEIGKIPPTIISRCQRFDFHRLDQKSISDRLMYIAKKENFKLEQNASDLIAHIADGAMRDALSLLDQAAAIDRNIKSATISNIVGIAGDDYIYKIHKAIVDKNPNQALLLLDNLYNNLFDIKTICEQLISFYRYVMLFQTSQGDSGLIEGSPSLLSFTQKASTDISLTQTIHILNSLRSTLNNFKLSLNPRFELEICLVKLAYSKQNDIDRSGRSAPYQSNADSDDGGSAENFKNASANLNEPKIKEEKDLSNATSNDKNSLYDPSAENFKNADIPPDTTDIKDKKEFSNATSDDRDDKNLNINSKGSKQRENNATDFVPFKKWDIILKSLKSNAQTIMLSGFLKDSKAFVLDNKLKIILANPIIEKKVYEKKDILKKNILENTGVDYNISFESINSDNKQSLLSQTLTKANNMGIKIISE